jgi:hypothetical protein
MQTNSRAKLGYLPAQLTIVSLSLQLGDGVNFEYYQ